MMRVLFENKAGWVLGSDGCQDHRIFLESGEIFWYKKDLFDIKCPYLMDKEAEKVAGEMKGIYRPNAKRRKKMKKNDTSNEVFQSEMADCSEAAEFLSMVQSDCFTYKVSSKDIISNNSEIRKFVSNWYKHSAAKYLTTAKFSGQNNNAFAVKTNFSNCNSSFFIPPFCEFHNVDVEEFGRVLNGNLYDLIVVDPPWSNKQVKRSSSYLMLNNNTLKSIPFWQHLCPGGIAVVWCTNKKKHSDFLVNELFVEWGISLMMEWIWIKVTAGGQPVKTKYNNLMDSTERIFIGCDSKTNPSIPTNWAQKKFIVSVPSAISSQKPFLYDVLKDYFVDKTPRCLELFARSLHPHWTSVGNQVMLLQDEKLFESV